MPSASLSRQECADAVRAVEAKLAEGYRIGGLQPSAIVAAARDLGVDQSHVRARVRAAKERFGIEPKVPDNVEPAPSSRTTMSESELRAVVDAVDACLRDGFRLGNYQPSAMVEAARRLCVPPHKIRHRLQLARARGIEVDASLDAGAAPAGAPADELSRVKTENRRLRAVIDSVSREDLTRETIREHIIGLASSRPEPPQWLAREPGRKSEAQGVPTLFLSDWHWGEVVRESEVGGCNSFNLDVAHRRAEHVVDVAIDLLRNHLSGAKYDGMVVVLGGDMFSGNIHEELTATNELPIMPTVVDLYGVLVAVLERLGGEFGRLFVPAVSGNHGRLSRKPVAKERWASNFDWLLYNLVEKHFERDKRITFMVPEGTDCDWRVYRHRYKLTHGDQFRGGDGLIGPLGPITRGRHKKASRDSGLGTHWDTLLVGHFHTLMQLPHLIVNGALKGYDEFAFQNNFSYEPPAQALWITHPHRGITFQMPVYCDPSSRPERDSQWVSWRSQ